MDILNSTNVTGEYINKSTDADIGITIATTLLSIIGALVIFIESAKKYIQQRTLEETRTLLVCLTIADLFIAIGNLVGAIRFIFSTDNVPGIVLACHDQSETGCVVQSVVTTLFSMSSFFWTTFIAFNLWWTYEDYFSSEGTTNQPIVNKRTIIYHLISWGIPGV